MAKLFSRKKSAPAEETLPESVVMNNFEPTTPSVNIIPKEVLTRYADDRMRSKFFALGGVLLMVGSLGFAGSLMAVNSSEEQLETLQNENRVLTAESAELAPGKQYIDLLDSKRSAIHSKVQRDIAQSKIVSEMSRIGKETGTTVVSMSVSPLIMIGEGGSAAGATECPSPDPFGTTSGVACISFTTESGREEDASSFGSELQKEGSIFTNVFIGSLTTSNGVTTMQGSVLVNTEVLTNRFEGLNQGIYDYLEFSQLEGQTPPAEEEEVVEETDMNGQPIQQVTPGNVDETVVEEIQP